MWRSDRSSPPPLHLSLPTPFEFAEIEGCRIHFEHRRCMRPYNAPTLVCIHGFGGNLLTWNDVAPLIDDRYGILRLDLRGFGHSDKPDDWRYSAADQADVVCNLITQRELSSVVLLGHSYGGAVALLALRRLLDETPCPVKGIVVLSSAGFPLRIPFQVAIYRFPAAQRLIAWMTSADWRIEFTLRRLYHSRNAIPAERVRRYSPFLDLPGSHTAYSRVAQLIRATDTEAIVDCLRRVTLPFRVIWGRNDRIIPPAHAQRFLDHVPGGSVEYIDGCGHAPQEEQPAATAHAVERFMETLP